MNRIVLALLFVFSCSATSFAQPMPGQLPPPIDIPVQNVMQNTNVWCWAAVAQQIILFRQGWAPQQCELVEAARNMQPGTCCQMEHPSCLTGGALQEIQNFIMQFGFAPSVYAPPTDPMTLYNTLQANRVVILQVRTGPQMAHVIVLRGMFFQQTPTGIMPMLIINDPMSLFTQPMPFTAIAPYWMSAIVVQL